MHSNMKKESRNLVTAIAIALIIGAIAGWINATPYKARSNGNHTPIAREDYQKYKSSNNSPLLLYYGYKPDFWEYSFVTAGVAAVIVGAIGVIVVMQTGSDGNKPE